ncbi:leucyl/phenylalanyl-tRNA--protein transferase [Rhodoblastus acidophilus]|uniref:Leucyl/phenylalanyl-tRNA--protein transferase n=1 Tax=Candidatus Rhodoblastus alkanivorans TaxID=2954117 RepID=A0ABS9Z9H2_9HYPH|nr:leucyl/phenylalanyl-tRNA--protein transferase [Candidatus Rhodoblastus alkanivorans]MCI4680761.1 leucyl/phenylalanyl-tRNA--protein transferase [Candidatus Rhodoblastus alkanivorans]MCI4683272.1 leucyl/phenylalanyl-tRNA--protein transferase [Candidatus Rhodoblastus alkanivorans]MDI4640584.1 leucyl/phenylalanyl-tRNA--protein transferase [Rhodoblastus acidophilus]
MRPPPPKPEPITPRILLRAYAAGLFPMAEDAEADYLHWFDPRERGIFPLDRLSVSKSLAKAIKAKKFDIRIDQDFDAVLAGCAESRPGREKTWINKTIAALFRELFDMGFAHTVEAWREGELVGGLYGLALGGAFFGESMFHHVTDASKVCLTYLVARLRFGGFSLLDAQFVTPHLESLGAIEISRADYRRRLDAALDLQGDFRALDPQAAPEEVLSLVRAP